MHCDKCHKKVKALVKVQIDIYNPKDPKSAFHTTQSWCLGCVQKG